MLAEIEALPHIIQGGMGVAVSHWVLANAVSTWGGLGVVSGTCIDSIMVRRLQDGDPGGHVRRAISEFPLKDIAEKVLATFYVEGGLPKDEPYRLLPMYKRAGNMIRDGIVMLGAFVEVFLAKEGHQNPVGMNLLTKIQLPNLASLYGAMLAGVDYVLMGAGIPKEIPGALDKLSQHEPARLKMEVEDTKPGMDPEYYEFSPKDYLANNASVDASVPLKRPRFLAIVSSHSLANMLARKASGKVDGFIVEGPLAGGHNAPPREGKISETGEPLYTERDVVDLEEMKKIGLPFWLAGHYGDPAGLTEAMSRGAQGIQVGTLFAFCRDSGLTPELRAKTLGEVKKGTLNVLTDGRASPTGFPFKCAVVPETMSEAEVYQKRERICDLGYLRTAYRKESGQIGFRCASEPERDFLKKGGAEDELAGRKCLCNALMSTVGFGQRRGDGQNETPLVTAGDQLKELTPFLEKFGTNYSAVDVLEYLSKGLKAIAWGSKAANFRNGNAANGTAKAISPIKPAVAMECEIALAPRSK